MDFSTALVDSSTEVLHDFLSTILQLKATLRVAQSNFDSLSRTMREEMVSKEVIGHFQGQIDDLQARIDQAIAEKENAQKEADANRQKASHIDTFVNEINTYKATVRDLESKNTACVDKILELETTVAEKEAAIKALEKLQKKAEKVDKKIAAKLIVEKVDNSMQSKTITTLDPPQDDF